MINDSILIVSVLFVALLLTLPFIYIYLKEKKVNYILRNNSSEILEYEKAIKVCKVDGPFAVKMSPWYYVVTIEFIDTFGEKRGHVFTFLEEIIPQDIVDLVYCKKFFKVICGLFGNINNKPIVLWIESIAQRTTIRQSKFKPSILNISNPLISYIGQKNNNLGDIRVRTSYYFFIFLLLLWYLSLFIDY